MSSLRNAVKRKTHKERSQPSDRTRWGLLEKHKDYVLRAKDFHRKEKTIQVLREKASFKNPDEFYYKMINSETVDGIHRRKNGGKQYTAEEILLMKTQDIRYVLNKAQSERKKVERLQSVLHSVGQPLCNTHVYFAEDIVEAKQLPLAIEDQPQASKPLPERIRKKQAVAYRELEERKERAEKLKNMTVTMGLQKQIMGKGRKRKLRANQVPAGEDTVKEEPVFKWRQVRKK